MSLRNLPNILPWNFGLEVLSQLDLTLTTIDPFDCSATSTSTHWFATSATSGPWTIRPVVGERIPYDQLRGRSARGTKSTGPTAPVDAARPPFLSRSS